MLTNTRILPESWKVVEYISDGDTNCGWCGMVHKYLEKRELEIGDQRKNGDHLDYNY